MSHPKNIAALKKTAYQYKSIKEELRSNLIHKLKNKEKIFEGILGYDDTVIPDLQRAILSKHNINLLGLRGQAKTRIARQLTELLDEWIPVITGCELNSCPYNPISYHAKKMIEEYGDETPISWLHRNERFGEKLATPDVSVADLIGDVDPIKAANLKISYADERVIHFGIIPRSNRMIFVINELPDLQARIQVSLFNILQEGDIQIRGFKFRIPLDIQFVFTANPEDYTNRGSIVTPLKDRIGSQILTHYPKSIELSKKITEQEAKLSTSQLEQIQVSDLIKTLIERVAFEARDSEYVDAKSGVSARLTISSFENVVSAAELRMMQNNDSSTTARISDMWAIITAVNGKIEMVYEGEIEGPVNVVQQLIGKAIRNHFTSIFPDPTKLKKKKQINIYQAVADWFTAQDNISILVSDDDATYKKKLDSIEALELLLKEYMPDLNADEKYVYKEFILHALAECSQLGRSTIGNGVQFNDLLGSMIDLNNFDVE
jgi:magnesium chelatase subunit I